MNREKGQENKDVKLTPKAIKKAQQETPKRSKFFDSPRLGRKKIDLVEMSDKVRIGFCF